VAAAAPVTAFSASIENDSYFALLFRFGLIPATLFSGVFFPVTQLPLLLRPLAYVSPLWHGVVLSRAATLGMLPAGESWLTMLLHLAYLILWAVAGLALAVWRFRKRLQD
jgi:lipooligosaccharide transport system permease protein